LITGSDRTALEDAQVEAKHADETGDVENVSESAGSLL
jgi:hypothetical protein